MPELYRFVASVFCSWRCWPESEFTLTRPPVAPHPLPWAGHGEPASAVVTLERAGKICMCRVWPPRGARLKWGERLVLSSFLPYSTAVPVLYLLISS